mgnify:CR=1 FL=1
MLIQVLNQNIYQLSLDLLLKFHIPESTARYLNVGVLIILVIVIAWLADKIFNVIITQVFHRLEKRKHGDFFKALIRNKVIRKLSHLIPLILFSNSVPYIFTDFPEWGLLVGKGINILTIVLIAGIFSRIFRSLTDVGETRPGFMDKPLESYRQVVNILLFIVVGTLIFAEVTGKEVWAFFTAMGALSAILLLVFKDTILGFVASIQVTTNDMVRIGDWIEMPKYGADGDVEEITLTTVKVRNWDKTITTIPTYALISDSFKNWRGMQNTGGRRIKRALYLKIASVKFLTDEEIARFRKIQLISEYVESRKAEIDEHNKRIKADKSTLINGRNLTNIGLFRQYIYNYISQHPSIHKEMIFMVRQLPPSEKGMPLEIYAFTNTIKWLEYEPVMADIFDHVFAAAPYFDLVLFEDPSGSDIRSLYQVVDTSTPKE